MSLIKKYLKLRDKYVTKYGKKTILYMQVGAFFEVYGLPCVEAMNSNLPVISSNIPSIKEIMGNAGIYCKPLDVECFVKKITKLITNNKFYLKKKRKVNKKKKFYICKWVLFLKYMV